MRNFVLFLEVSTIQMLEAKFPAVKVLFVLKIFSTLAILLKSNNESVIFARLSYSLNIPCPLEKHRFKG